MRLGKLLAGLMGLLSLSTIASATIVTSDATATVTATQSGLYTVDAGLFSTRTRWDSISPRDQWGYSQVIWQVNIPGVTIPEGSTINSATLDWYQYTWRDQSITDATFSCLFCLSGSLYIFGGAETFVNWVEVGGTYYWLPKSDYNSTGKFDLLALGFGSALLNGDSAAFNGGHQVNLANAQVDLVDDFFLSNTQFRVTYNNHMTMTGNLIIDFTAPSPPVSSAPESRPAFMVAFGLSVVAFRMVKLRNTQRRTDLYRL